MKKTTGIVILCASLMLIFLSILTVVYEINGSAEALYKLKPTIVFYLSSLVIFVLALFAGDFLRANRLINEGYCVKAEFDSLKCIKQYGIDEPDYYVINFKYEDPENGEIYKFVLCKYLNYNPSLILELKGILVYVDRNDFTNYYVDASELEKYDMENR